MAIYTYNNKQDDLILKEKQKKQTKPKQIMI